MQVVGLIFVTILGTAVGLTCFQCNSHTDTACDDFFSGDSEAMREAFQVTCVPPSNATEEPLCRKTTIAIYHYNDSATRVIRECGYGWRKSTHVHRDCYPVTQEDYDVQVCQCHGDNCNGALEKRVWAPLMLVSAAAASLLALCSA